MINNQNKRIYNSREAFLFENEKLILGKKGITLKNYPSRKERFKLLFRQNRIKKDIKIKSNSFNIDTNKANDTFYSHKNFSNNNINNSMYGLNNNKLLNLKKNKTQLHFFKKNPNNINLKLKANPLSLILSDPFENNKFNNLKKVLNSTKYKTNYKYFTPISKNINKNKINEKIKFAALKFKKKTNKLNSLNKTHFKGLESILVKPKEIYDLFKMEDLLKVQKLNNNYDMKTKQKKDEASLEKKNEYKLDIKEILEEEQEIQNIINTKAFSNLLGNRKFFKEIGNKNDSFKMLKNESNEDHSNDNTQDKKMDYLKKIAFRQKLNDDKGLNESESEDNSVNKEDIEQIKKRHDKKDLETELRIDGKIYQMKNQMDQISKALLIKYKVYEDVKNK